MHVHCDLGRSGLCQDSMQVSHCFNLEDQRLSMTTNRTTKRRLNHDSYVRVSSHPSSVDHDSRQYLPPWPNRFYHHNYAISLSLFAKYECKYRYRDSRDANLQDYLACHPLLRRNLLTPLLIHSGHSEM